MKNRIRKIGAALVVALLLCFNSVTANAEINGIDISSYQNDIAYPSNIKYVYVKATEGTNYINPKMISQYNSAQGRNRGFYHFMNASNPISQAEHFYNTIKNYSYNMKPCLDIEVTYGMSVDTISNRVVAFCNRFKQLSGQGVIIYTGSYFQRYNINSTVQKSYEFWVASYYLSTINNVTVANGTRLIGGQLTDKYNINGQYVDGNEFTESILLGNSNNTVSGSVTNNVGISNSYINIAKNYVGSNAKRTQYLLNALGYNLTTDGIIGQNSATAIGNFQSSNGLTKDYMFGNQCKQAAYNKLKYKTCGIKYITPEQTKYIQYRLNINVDGVFGMNTAIAVKQFQRHHGLVQDGIVGQNTWYYLIMYQN